MAGVLASTAAAVGILDKAMSIPQKLAHHSDEQDKATLKLELTNLMVELANTKIKAVTTQTLLFDAEQKIKDLEEKLKDKSTFTFKHGLYWKGGDETAFCPKCYEVNQIKTHMVLFPAGQTYSAYWSCQNCRFST
ncbi:hypothetical protein [Lelliottia sp.]|uniref:hypothetical protein n=1 Tax=Lelliottia sp. TaxID=1898429 RepID=UPI00389056A5